MLDEFGSRTRIIPAEVEGPYRRWRDRVYFILLIVFLGLPWVKIQGLQALHFDIPARRFVVAGKIFLAHDAPILFLALGGFVMALAFVTSVWGRVWCGWACPQTVFIEGVYRRLERWVEGGYIERRRLRDSPWTFRKFRLWLTKWFLFTAVSSIFAHSFIAYFAGADDLIEMMKQPPANNFSYFLLVSAFTLGLMFMFGWFREQFCIIMCPYGRFQSVMMDEKSKTVHYDIRRGEPRKGSAAAQAGQAAGDCVSCNRCVQVCPTGIDIRDGLQMDCIACTACMDACDAIMAKVKKPAGLISYRSEVQSTSWAQRPRALAYAALAAVFIAALLIKGATHQTYSALVLRAKDTPYQELPGGVISNHFKLHILNQSHGRQEFTLALHEDAAQNGVRLTTAMATSPLEAGKSAEVHFFILVPADKFSQGEAKIMVRVSELSGGTIRDLQVTAVGPYSSGGGS